MARCCLWKTAHNFWIEFLDSGHSLLLQVATLWFHGERSVALHCGLFRWEFSINYSTRNCNTSDRLSNLKPLHPITKSLPCSSNANSWKLEYLYLNSNKSFRLPYACHYQLHVLYILYPNFDDHFIIFKDFFFQKIWSLCIVSFQERFVIKSKLWWRAYCIWLQRWFFQGLQ